METPKRILLKLSGELLAGNQAGGFDSVAARMYVNQIKELHDQGTEVVLVVGGGNFYRGRTRGEGVREMTAHRMGMLGSVMTALAFRDELAKTTPARAISTIHMPQFIETYRLELAEESIARGEVLVFGGGTAMPGFTTDTTAAIMAHNLGCGLFLKGTNVDGVYDKDPDKHDNAEKYDAITYDEALEKELRVMDMTAFAWAREYEIPTIVFDITQDGAITKAAKAEIGTRVHGESTV